MSAVLNQSSEVVIAAPCGMTELVRGCDQRLIDLLSPLVHDQNVSFDMRAIERIDAAGISALIALYGKARIAGHTFTVCNVATRVEEILSLVGLDHILVSHDVVRASQSGISFACPAA